MTTRETDERFGFAENHAMSDEDRALFERLNIGAGTTTIIPHDKVVVNKGETMRTETIIHHVHREFTRFILVTSATLTSLYLSL
jgi:hypothetical protein